MIFEVCLGKHILRQFLSVKLQTNPSIKVTSIPYVFTLNDQDLF